ncbi:MAG: hypothetical protein WCL00_01620 [Bacteroidota bacterium]
MAARRALYEAVRDKITVDLPWVKWIDLQKGQFDTPAKNYPLPLPCVLVEIKPVAWENYSSNTQLGQTLMSIYIYLDHSGDSIKGSEMEKESLRLMDRMDRIFQVLTDLSGNSFKRLTRINDQVVKYRPRMVEFRSDFSTTIFDSIEPLTAPLPLPQIQSNIEIVLT